MAGRRGMPRHPMHDGPQGFRDGPPPLFRGPGPVPISRFEEELEIKELESRRLREDNSVLHEQNVARARQLRAIEEELHVKSQDIPKLRAEKEAHVRDLIQKGLKLEAELRGLEPVKQETVQLKSEAQKLDLQCQELSTKSLSMSQDLKHLQAENQQIPAIKHDVEGLRQELSRFRSAFEYEKKAHAELLDQRQVMENNLISMAREIEKLKAENRSGEKRAGGAGFNSYGALNSISDTSYLGALGDTYGGDKGFYGPGGSYDGGSYDVRGISRR